MNTPNHQDNIDKGQAINIAFNIAQQTCNMSITEKKEEVYKEILEDAKKLLPKILEIIKNLKKEQ